ncbi:MAG: tetratricopeptide repeat protein, partial [Fidelibacterota bacterium]
GRNDVDHIDEALGKDIARHAQLDVLVIASIRKLGRLYCIDLKALVPEQAEYLFTAREEGEGQECIPDLLDRLAEKTRVGLKEKYNQVQATSSKIATLTTPNLEAYQHYFQGEEYINKLQFEEAQKEFRRAVALDSTFGLAWYRLAYAISWFVGREEVAIQPARKAFALLDRIPEKERYLVRAEKARLEAGMAAGLEVLREMERTFPDDKEMMYNIGDWAYHLGDYQTTVVYLQKVLAVDPTFPRALQHLCWVYRDTGEFSKMRTTAQRYVDATQSEEAGSLLAEALILLGKPHESINVLETFRKTSSRPWAYLDVMAGINAYLGEHSQAESLLLHLIDMNQPPEAKQRGYLQLANWYAYLGRYREALRACDQYIETALTAGDTAQAATQKLYKAALLKWGLNDHENSLKEVEETQPYQHRISSPYYWGYRILIQIYEHEFSLAERQITEHFGDPDSGPVAASFLTVLASTQQDCDQAATYLERTLQTPQGFIKMYALYHAAECHFNAGRYGLAVSQIEELQSLTYESLSKTSAIYYPRSIYLLGRAFEELGNHDDALVQYERFLDLWKQADKDSPLLIDAQARYRSLKAKVAS